MFYLALLVLAFVLGVAAVLVVKGRDARDIAAVEIPGERREWPLVSIIAPARNEERNIEAAVRSLAAIDYAPLEITIINDRSTDRTGEILDSLAAEYPQLNVVHLTELPPGWLGKNHALQYGADRSHGEWLLFTDADIVFEPSALRRAIVMAEADELDMLAAFPGIDMPSWMLESFVVTFGIFFVIFTRPWAVSNPRSSAHCGIGAFNLLRASAYQKADGHRPLAMRPDDDLKLGKTMKLSGARCDIVDGRGMIRVPWYGSVRELIVGLEKNSFAAVEYSVTAVAAATIAIVVFNLLPFVAVFFVAGPTRWLFGAAALIQLALAWRGARHLGLPSSVSFGYPVAVAMFIYIQWRAMALTLRQGGIKWRDTFYSLKELRANKV
ncbi:MAG: glycosyltransferase family 2 protein [Pirellulales bacterium]